MGNISREKQTVSAKSVGEVPADTVEQKDEQVTEETIAETGPVNFDGDTVTAPLKPADRKKSPRADALKADLQKEESRLEAALKPHREFYERHVNDPKYIEARAKIKEISRELADIKNELAAMARSSGTNVAVKAEPGTIGTK